MNLRSAFPSGPAFAALVAIAAPAGFAATVLRGSGADQEAAWVEWLPVEGASGYRVYLEGGSDGIRLLDDHLVRDRTVHGPHRSLLILP